MTLPSIEFVLNDNIITCNLEEDLRGVINDEIVRPLPPNLKIEAYPRLNRPDKQQIYINNKYFMTVPCSKYNQDPDLEDPYNFRGDEFIYLIEELYKRGYSLNNIKKIVYILLGHYRDIYSKPQY